MLFLAILHHLFVVLLVHLADIIAKDGVVSVEFEAYTTHLIVSVNFWEGKELVTMVVAYSGRDDLVSKSKLHYYYLWGLQFRFYQILGQKP